MMNILDRGFEQSKATLKYLDADFVVIRPGTFVVCAVTGKPIPLDDLKYWSVDRQEAYADADAALKAYQDGR